MADKDPERKLRTRAGLCAGRLAEEIARLRELRDDVPLDVEQVLEEMITWQECPSFAFYFYGALSSAVEEVESGLVHLHRAQAATPARIRRDWSEFKKSELAVRTLASTEEERRELGSEKLAESSPGGPPRSGGAVPLSEVDAEVERAREHLRVRIRAAGCDQRTLARRLGTTEGRVSALLHGRARLRFRDLIAVPAALGVPPALFLAELFGYEPLVLLEPAAVSGYRRLAELLLEKGHLTQRELVGLLLEALTAAESTQPRSPA